MATARKSSFCTKHACCCVEVVGDFARPMGADHEVVAQGDKIIVRNSSDRGAGHAQFTADEWRVFIEGAKHGEFDLP